MEEVDGISHSGEGGLVGAQRGEPCQDVRIALQLVEGLDLRVMGAEKSQEIAGSAMVETNGLLVEGSGEGLGGALEQSDQWMKDGRESVHNEMGKAGRTCCATARAYCSKTSRGEIC